MHLTPSLSHAWPLSQSLLVTFFLPLFFLPSVFVPICVPRTHGQHWWHCATAAWGSLGEAGLCYCFACMQACVCNVLHAYIHMYILTYIHTYRYKNKHRMDAPRYVHTYTRSCITRIYMYMYTHMIVHCISPYAMLHSLFALHRILSHHITFNRTFLHVCMYT